jgi:hypothetical protein
VIIAALSGTAGVGKTTLAVHWAHRVSARFPDGQLYVNLKGFDPGGEALDPSEAARGFLEAFGVPVTRIPADLPGQTGLYRSLLAGRRVLVVLDNARDVEQVRPLLPGSPGCLALVTSRSHLTGLVADEGAYPLALDLLPAADARDLLIRRLGSSLVTSEPAAVDDIIARCARLPLALTIAAARAATSPSFPLAVFAAELREATRALDSFDGGDLATDIRAVFSWSYGALSAAAARLFRLLGLHPGPDIGLSAAASLAAIQPDQARTPLAELTRAHLLAEHSPGRYAFHDLLRSYAAEQAQAHDSQPVRDAAVDRLLDHYLHTARNAAMLIEPHFEPPALMSAHPGVSPGEPGTAEDAMSWFQAEHAILLATVQLAADAGHARHVWRLAWMLSPAFIRRGSWTDHARAQHAVGQQHGTGFRVLGGGELLHRDLQSVHGWQAQHGSRRGPVVRCPVADLPVLVPSPAEDGGRAGPDALPDRGRRACRCGRPGDGRGHYRSDRDDHMHATARPATQCQHRLFSLSSAVSEATPTACPRPHSGSGR